MGEFYDIQREYFSKAVRKINTLPLKRIMMTYFCVYTVLGNHHVQYLHITYFCNIPGYLLAWLYVTLSLVGRSFSLSIRWTNSFWMSPSVLLNMAPGTWNRCLMSYNTQRSLQGACLRSDLPWLYVHVQIQLQLLGVMPGDIFQV